MNEINELYGLLEQMVHLTIEGDKKKVLGLDDKYQRVMQSVPEAPTSPEYLKMDRCRQSCVLFFTMPGVRYKLLKAIEEEFQNIPKPR